VIPAVGPLPMFFRVYGLLTRYVRASRNKKPQRSFFFWNRRDRFSWAMNGHPAKSGNWEPMLAQATGF